MLIQVSGKGFGLSSQLRDEVAAKIKTGLERFRTRIGKVSAFLEDVNGLKSGRDKCLRLVIDIQRLPLLVVEEKGEAWQALLDNAVERTAHTVSRQIDRLRSISDRTSMAGEIEHDSRPERNVINEEDH